MVHDMLHCPRSSHHDSTVYLWFISSLCFFTALNIVSLCSLQTTALKNGSFRHDIHYWLGKDTSQVDFQTFDTTSLILLSKDIVEVLFVTNSSLKMSILFLGRMRLELLQF
jgi:hypothetical protein